MSFSKIFIGLYACAVFVIYSFFYKEHKTKFYRDNRTKLKSDHYFKYINIILQLIVVSGVIISQYTTRFSLVNHFGIKIIGIIISLIGTMGFIFAKKQLGNNYSPCFDLYEPISFTHTNLYQFIRHPIYTSNLLTLLGFYCMSGLSPVLLLCMSIVAFHYYRSACAEEENMLSKFSDYAAYMQKTGRFLPVFSSKSINNN